MKNTQHNPEIQLELPGMKTGFYVFMNKYSMNLPDVKELENATEAGIKKFTEENQLSLAVWI